MALTGGERRPGPRATVTAGPIEARNGREVRGAPPLACADWSVGSIPGSDWPRRRSVWRGAVPLPIHAAAGARPERGGVGRGARGPGCGHELLFRAEMSPVSSSSWPCVRVCLPAFPLPSAVASAHSCHHLRCDTQGGGAVPSVMLLSGACGIPVPWNYPAFLHTHPVVSLNTAQAFAKLCLHCLLGGAQPPGVWNGGITRTRHGASTGSEAGPYLSREELECLT